jgi:hypothetical protein
MKLLFHDSDLLSNWTTIDLVLSRIV